MNRRRLDTLWLLGLLLAANLLPACQTTANPGLEVLSLEIIPSKVTQGEKAIVRTEIRNSSESEQTYTVPLMVNGVAEDRTSFTLASGATKIIEFSLVRSEVNNYKVKLGDRELFFEVYQPPPPIFKVSDLKVNPDQVNAGEDVLINIKLANIGGSRGSYTVELKINGSIEKTQTYTLAAGEVSNLGFFVSRSTPGTYSVALAELKSEFVVTEPIIPVEIAPPVCPPSTKWNPTKKC